MAARLSVFLAWFVRLAHRSTDSRIALGAGGLAYFVTLAIVPMAVAFGGLAGLVLDPDEIRSALAPLVSHATGTNAASVVDSLVSLVESSSTTAFTVTTIVSVVVAVYAASKVPVGLRLALNSIFGVGGARSGLVERGVGAIVTLAALVLGVAGVLLLTAVPRAIEALGIQQVQTSTGVWILDWAVLLAVTYVGSRLVLRYGPDRGPTVTWLSPGAGVAAAWIVAVTAGLGLAVRCSASLGAAVVVMGATVAVLLWLYLCFLGLLTGGVVEADRAMRRAPTTRTSAGDLPPAR